MTPRLVLVQARTPLHAGTGQSVAAIDLPIAREKPTGIPLVPGSSIKGALRARDGSPLKPIVFGPETNRASEHAGAVHLSDVHVVLLPVRSLAGTFAWVTSPYLLSRFARDAREAGFQVGALPISPALDQCMLLADTLVAQLGNQRRVVLEDLDFTGRREPNPPGELADLVVLLARELYPGPSPEATFARTFFSERVCLVHDDVMSYLLETATEVVARIRLAEETKTVAKGALWYEESLPAETVLAGLAVASAVKRNGTPYTAATILDHVAQVAKGLVQLGGKATVGRGNCRVQLAAPAATTSAVAGGAR